MTWKRCVKTVLSRNPDVTCDICSSITPSLTDCTLLLWKHMEGNHLYSKSWSTFSSTDIDYLMKEQILWNMVISGPSWIIHMAILHRRGASKLRMRLKKKKDGKGEVMGHVGPSWTGSLITSVDLDLVRSSLPLSPAPRCRLTHWVSLRLSWSAANLICLLTQISVEL